MGRWVGRSVTFKEPPTKYIMSLFISIESSSSGYWRGNQNQRTVISSRYCKTIKELAGFCAGYFTLFKTLRTMVIYIYIPGTGYFTYLIAIAFNFCKKVCVNSSSSSRKQYVKFSVNYLSLPFWAFCVGCSRERSKKKWILHWESFERISMIFFLFKNFGFVFYWFTQFALREIILERMAWFLGFLAWLIYRICIERERERDLERIPWSLGFWVGWNLYQERVLERNSMTFGCFCWFIEFVLREFCTEWNP